MQVPCYWCEGTGDEELNSLVRVVCSWCEGRGELDGEKLIRELAESDETSVKAFLTYLSNNCAEGVAERLEAFHDSLAWQEDPWGQRHGAMNCRRCGIHCTQAEVSNTYDADYQGEESGYVDWFCCAECVEAIEAKEVA